MKRVSITSSVEVGGGAPLLLIAGPCQIESRDHTLRIAEFLQGLVMPFPVNLVFKSSFDKANRTSLSGVRGLGMDKGLRILEEVKKTLGLPILTDIHHPEQAAPVAEVADVLQIPAFMCRQTDLLLAAGKTGKAVQIKKGQFLPPQDMRYSFEKVKSGGSDRVLLCERGVCFGYRDLVVDMRNLLVMRALGQPVIFDATHSTQSLGGGRGKSGGSRRYVLPLARGAAAVGVDGLFFECHDNPDAAPSDGPCMLPLDQVEKLVATVCRVHAIARESAQEDEESFKVDVA